MSVDQSEVLVTVETTEVLVPTGNVVIISGIGGGGGGVSDHPSLTGRSTADSHPTSAITGLDAALAARQPLDSDLTAIAALTTTAYGRALLSLVDLPALRSVIGPTGTPSASTFLRGDGQWATPAGGGGGDLLAANNLSDVANAATALANLGGQPSDSDLTAIAALTTTAFGRSFLTLADAAGARTLLVLGTAAQNNTGDFDAAGAAAAAQAASDPVGSAASAVSAHEADTTAVHGIADTSALLDTADIDTDATMAANSDAKVPSQKAVKTALSPGGIAGIYDLIAGGAVRLTDVGSPSYTTTIDGLSVNVQKFQTVGTYLAGWVKPANALFVQVIAIGGGGGGGSGQRVATTAVHAKGGSGGSPGGWDEQTFLASALGSTEDVVVGDGGNGGVAKTADGPGNDGVGGGLSSFGQTSAPWVTGTGGGGGRGGVVWNITDGSRTAGGVVTLTVPTGHTVVAGDRIQVNAADTTYNGSGFAVTSVTATTIVYTQTGGGVDASCGAGQVEVHTRRLGGVGSLTPYLALTTTGDNVAMSPYVTIQNGRLGGVGAGLLQPVPIAGCTDYIGPGGGGGGGGCIGSFAFNPASQGGAGKFGGIFGVGNAGGAAGTGVAGPGGVGSSMTTIHADWVGGGGGAGGGAGSFTAAQAGGVGGEGGKYGGGGGGGGNGVGANSGAGGKGGQGVVIVVTYCAAV